MAEEEKMIPIGETHETPQAITITIMDPSALGTPNIASSIVTSVEPQKTTGSSTSGNCNLLMVSSSGEQEPKSSILQTVTETHMGTEELPIISSISNPDHDESAELETKISQTLEGMEGEMAQEGPNEPVGQHCLICNIDIEPNEVEEDEEEQQQVPVFKSLTTSTNRRISIFLGGLVGQKLTSRKAHSDIMCRRCFNLLDRVDSLEVEIKETKEEIVNKYQETLTVHGGRARRKKPSTARKSEYVFPKVEPEDEDDQMLGLETDGTFEPRLEDLIEEEHDRREDVNPDDDEWEPEFKRTRIKREIDMDSGVPPKRKRGRPRKDATRPKDNVGAVTIGQAANIPMGEWLQAGSCSGSAVVLRPSCSPATRPRPSSYRPCDLCGIIPFSGAERHYAEHHPETLSRPCSLCEARFRTFRQLSSHVLKVHGPTLLCPTCSEAFIDITDFETHLKVSHNEIPAAFTCVVCQNSLTDVKSYCSHMETHQTEARVILEKGKHGATELESVAEVNSWCSLCQKDLRNPVALKTHMKQAHGMKPSFQCQVCYLRYQSSASLLDHIETHATGAINCPLCDHQFAKFVHLRNHCDVVHGNTASFRCHHCSYVAKSINTLFTHAVIRHPDHLGLARNVQCTKCGEKFHSGRELSQHKASRHAKLVNCKYCGKQYSKYHISAHINEKHTKEHNLDCSFCNKTFYSQTKLSVHIKRHHKREEYAKFICELCSKSYITHSELVRHISSHKNLRRYKCEFCSRAYFKAGDLTYHRRTHTGERPHKCVSCEAAFIRPSELKTHLVRAHGIHHHPRGYIRTAGPHIPSLGSGEMMRTAIEPTDETLCESVVNIQESSTIPDEQIVTPGGNIPCQLIAEVGDEGLVVEVVDGDMQVVEGVEETMQRGHEEGAIHVPQTLTEAFSQEHVQSFQNDGSDTQVIYLEIVE